MYLTPQDSARLPSLQHCAYELLAMWLASHAEVVDQQKSRFWLDADVTVHGASDPVFVRGDIVALGGCRLPLRVEVTNYPPGLWISVCDGLIQAFECDLLSRVRDGERGWRDGVLDFLREWGEGRVRVVATCRGFRVTAWQLFRGERVAWTRNVRSWLHVGRVRNLVIQA